MLHLAKKVVFLAVAALLVGFGSLLDQTIYGLYAPMWQNMKWHWARSFHLAACLSYALCVAAVLTWIVRPDRRVATRLWTLAMLFGVLALWMYDFAGKTRYAQPSAGIAAVLVFYAPALLAFAYAVYRRRTRGLAHA